jgi:hypothetical protein
MLKRRKRIQKYINALKNKKNTLSPADLAKFKLEHSEN